MAKLLVVDDEPQLLFSVREYLTRVGYAVDAAESGAEALALLMEEPPDLIVADILMEEMDGFELQRRVVALTGGRIPFIFLTAKSDLTDRLTGLRAGADDYVVKPFEPEELEARIASVLARVEITRRQERAALEQARSRTLADVSDRLLDPLASMVDQLDRLAEVAKSTGAPLDDDTLRQVRRYADRVENAVDELSLAADGLHAEEALDKRPMRIAPIIRTSAANAARLAARKGVDLQISCGGLLSGVVDGEALRRALTALLDAAVEMSPQGSEVAIRARRSREGGLEIAITDGGTATDEDSLPLGAGASGRALEYARMVIKAHGGTFDTRCHEGRCSIVMWLPGRVAMRIGKRP